MSELEDLARLVGFHADDEWILVGDLLNKGPDSRGVLDWAREHHALALQGNHEWRFQHALDTEPERRSPKENALLAAFGEDAARYGEWVRTWPLWKVWPDVVAVHAGLQPGVSRLEDMRRKVLLTIRTWDGVGEELDRPSDPPWYEVARWPVPVVFGHWAAGGLVDLPQCKGLDTGCVYGGKLTAWSPDEGRFWQVPAHREWVPFKD